ncbi:tetratricopeptide repeat protein [Massilia aurea]|uniref:tetratricopeptide repeat protein n=1 Tax=Massilia aurea TaxID=373040 RepID=UPI000F2DDE1D|nr:tetratricopeptide repeat protein [Massilia aurea]
MFIDKIPGEQANLAIEGANVEIIVLEDDDNPLAFVLPPTEDLAEIAALGSKNFSIKEYSNTHIEKNSTTFEKDFRKLQSKAWKFQDSPVYFSRLASLAAIRKDFQLESEYLNEASRLSDEKFYLQKRGENLICLGKLNEARDLFKKMHSAGDYYSSLRLASFEISNNNFAEAFELVEQAVQIDPADYNGRLFQGALRIINGQAQNAIVSFKIALEDRPTSSVAYSNLAIAYALLKQDDKAVSALKRAVALNPLNSNALTILADLAFKHNINSDAIPSLRYFVEFEQKSHAIWSRLARALLEVGAYDESLSALKRQASLGDSSEAWNNIGVAYFRKKDNARSISAFGHAMKLEVQEKGKEFFLAARNAAIVLAKERPPKDVIGFIESILVLDEKYIVSRDPVLSDLISTYLHLLTRANRVEQAKYLGEQLIERENVSQPLRVFAATGLLSLYAFREEAKTLGLELANRTLSWIDQIDEEYKPLKERLINNIAFIFANNGMLKSAEAYLSKISYLIHHDPYPTAVLGLIHFKKGNVERGVKLYEDAIHLASDKVDKSRIRQKFYIEMAEIFREDEPARALRYLQKSINVKNGDTELVNYVKHLVSTKFLQKPVGKNPNSQED